MKQALVLESLIHDSLDPRIITQTYLDLNYSLASHYVGPAILHFKNDSLMNVQVMLHKSNVSGYNLWVVETVRSFEKDSLYGLYRVEPFKQQTWFVKNF